MPPKPWSTLSATVQLIRTASLPPFSATPPPPFRVTFPVMTQLMIAPGLDQKKTPPPQSSEQLLRITQLSSVGRLYQPATAPPLPSANNDRPG